MKLYVHIAQLVQAIRNCEMSGREEWRQNNIDRLLASVKEHMPRSGIDDGTRIDLDTSTPESLVFHTSYKITVKPSLIMAIEITISGPNRNDIKDYLYETFRDALTQEIEK